MDGALNEGLEFRDFYKEYAGRCDALVIRPENIIKSVSYIQVHKNEAAFIEGAICKEGLFDISTLHSCATLKALSVRGAVSGLQDLLHTLPLQWLAIDNTLMNEKIDFSDLGELQYLSIYKMNNKISGVSKLLALKYLRAWSFTSPTGNLESLCKLSQLAEIELNSPRITSLDGLSQLKALRKIHLCYCRNSIDVKDIFASKSIDYIEIEKGNPAIPEAIRQSQLFESVFDNGHYRIFQRRGLQECDA